ncbi:MAG: RNA pseudouridine synthase [Bdellovibrio sp. CG10_big_fil_rev_8_21_14_0_10_47_8]|nr:MAG: RNA pseudouridine synthase [Bdellovibrio sp. CG10_big_fil_rev_8_21_14_0_10_47_8]
MKILFQNRHVVAVDKAAGVLTVPGRLGKEDPRPVLGLQLQEQLKTQVFPIHRLDFEVSGLVLFALSADAHRDLSQLFLSKEIQKSYQALTENKNAADPTPGQAWQWQARILRGKKRAFESPHGKESRTEATFIRKSNQGLRWVLRPVTGRSHQLRFDLSRNGYPIIGDTLYGALPGGPQNEISLRAVSLEIQNQMLCQKWELPSLIAAVGLFDVETAL